MNSVQKLPLKYFKRTNMYKSSTGNCTYDPSTGEAYSYKHWCFVKTIDGKVVFNDYSYSISTSGHQSHVRSLLRQLGIKIDVVVRMRASLNDFSSYALPTLYNELCDLIERSKRKGLRHTTRIAMEASITEIKENIAMYTKMGASITKEQLAQAAADAKQNERWHKEKNVRNREVNALARTEANDILNNSFQNV